MKRVALAAAFLGLLAWGAKAQSSTCEVLSAEQNSQAACKKARSKTRIPARSRSDGISRADKERNDRALTRNVLQSIEDQLRRQRMGN